MIILGKYDEFAPNMGFPSIKDYLHEESYDSKKAVLGYLRSGTVHMVTASKMVDIFTGETINEEVVFMDDGKYSWSSKLAYYVDRYNLKLPQDFEKHILNQ